MLFVYIHPTQLSYTGLSGVNDTHAILPPPPSASQRKPKGKGKAKEVVIDTSTFLPRVSSPRKVGGHVSAAGGVDNAVVNAASIGCVPSLSFCPTASLTVLCLFLSAYEASFRAAERPLLQHSVNAFALFLKSQHKWTSPSLQDTSIELFKKRMKDLDYDPKHVLPHGSYLINLGNPDRYVIQSTPALVPLTPVLRPTCFRNASEKRVKSYECFWTISRGVRRSG